MSKKFYSRLVMFGAIGVALFFIVFFMEKEYHEPYISSQFGWLKARLVAAVLAVVISFMLFTGGKIATGWRELKVEGGYLKDKNDRDLELQGYSGFEIWLIEAPLWGWMAWWVFCFEVMVSFHIDDWLKHGF